MSAPAAVIHNPLNRYCSIGDEMHIEVLDQPDYGLCVLVRFKSHGMVLCAKDEATDTCKFVDPPAGAKVGDRVGLEGLCECFIHA